MAMSRRASGRRDTGSDLLIAGKYKVGEKLGSGSFGEIYAGKVEGRDGPEYVAIKLEPVKTKHPQLMYEARLYNKLIKDSGAKGDKLIGVPRVHWYGVEGDYNVMVIDLLGPSLEDLFTYKSRRLSLKTVLMLGVQMVARIQFVHSCQYLHRDVKPDNFLMGVGKKAHHVYVIDFGLAKRYRDPKTGRHIPPKTGKALTGTARYASINTHVGLEQGRRDDLEAVGYVLMYFLRGSLPWQGLKPKGDAKEDKYAAIKEKKQRTPVESLCKGFPSCYATYINYCKGLKFEEEPDYQYLQRLFWDCADKERYNMGDCVYDWSRRE